MENEFSTQTNSQQLSEQEILSWYAQDLIIGEKNRIWYGLFFIAVTVLLIFSYLIKSWSFTLLIVASAVAVLVSRPDGAKSKKVKYTLTSRGVYIGSDFSPYGKFRAFGVVEDDILYSVVLLPKKRFSPSLTVYFTKENGEKIVDIFGSRLPMEEIKLDLIDKIVRKIKL